ncbi:MAG: type II toxin-antitoxin system HicB family antitoxin [Cephaloticoccus sp.]|nr:type II toxin-antitoxin system HicB family antitoxin [Cephaloticoccus sp.]
MKPKLRTFNLVIEKDRDGYFVASVPELRGCHTQAKLLDVLIKRALEAIELGLEVEADLPESAEFIGVQRITV